MSQESLASMAASEGNEPTILKSLPTSIQCPSVAIVVNNKMMAKQEELKRALGDDLDKFEVFYHLIDYHLKVDPSLQCSPSKCCIFQSENPGKGAGDLLVSAENSSKV